MTITTTENRVTRNGDGATTSFTYSFKIFAASDLKVYVDGVLQTAGYSVTGVGETAGGNVVFVTAPPAGTANVIFVREVPYTQETQLLDSGPFPAANTERALDKATILAQQINDSISRALRQPETDAAAIGALPARDARAGKFMAFDSNGNPVPTEGTGDATPHNSYMLQLHGAGNAAAARAVLDASATGDAVFTAATAADARSALGLGATPIAANVPIGGMMWLPGPPSPGWLVCFGQNVLRAAYPELFAVIGTSHGEGDGVTTFGLPDGRGRTLAGRDDMGGVAANRLQISRTLNTTSGSATAVVDNPFGLSVGMVIVSANVPAGTTITAMNLATITMSANATATALGTAARFSLLGDAQALGAAGGTQTHPLIAAENGPHTHPYAGATFNHGQGGGPNSMGNSDTAGNNRTTASSGGGQSHPNVQPTLVENLIIFAGRA